ncbi:MAG: tRNA (adenine(58)-N(1))-methyltransferase non-catalytic subunit trm6 [Peltula sp. TS41687]|nr:MAG: tRNA (adenine(58)-N(1))-methyltransferase non-catalytic subunit trm6 [Peltula sp. TS41687]
MLKITQIVPNTIISIGKYGSFPANTLLGRPYNLTFEIVEPSEDRNHTSLRVLSAAEIHAEGLVENEASTPDATEDGRIIYNNDGLEYEVMEDTGEVIMRTNREITDDPHRQKLSMEEIEALKKEGTGAGRDLISRLLLSHSGIGQKTAFSLAKYTLRKSRKFMRRFTVLPLDVSVLARWLLSKEPLKIMEIREETLALISSLANVRWSTGHEQYVKDGQLIERGCGRWLVVDETGGLIIATLAERMGILTSSQEDDADEHAASRNVNLDTIESGTLNGTVDDADVNTESHTRPRRPHRQRIAAMSATSNTITLLHANTQPNLSLLKYFLFDTNDPSPQHPLYTHLKTLSWLQLISPEDDAGYTKPEVLPDEILATWKSGKRATYFRKQRRWERVKAVVEDTQAGEFDGLIVASTMDPINILQHTVGLLRGGAPVIVYSPHVENLTELADLYSIPRRTAFLWDPPDPATLTSEDFPLDPTLLLAPTIQTATAHHWQCLPGRTHPLMNARGGAQGYLFTAIRVLPAEGRVEARGKFKRRKVRRDNTSNDDAAEENATLMDIDGQSETESANVQAG